MICNDCTSVLAVYDDDLSELSGWKCVHNWSVRMRAQERITTWVLIGWEEVCNTLKV